MRFVFLTFFYVPMRLSNQSCRAQVTPKIESDRFGRETASIDARMEMSFRVSGGSMQQLERLREREDLALFLWRDIVYLILLSVTFLASTQLRSPVDRRLLWPKFANRSNSFVVVRPLWSYWKEKKNACRSTIEFPLGHDSWLTSSDKTTVI